MLSKLKTYSRSHKNLQWWAIVANNLKYNSAITCVTIYLLLSSGIVSESIVVIQVSLWDVHVSMIVPHSYKCVLYSHTYVKQGRYKQGWL